MGSVRMGVPTQLVLSIRQQFGVDCFVETGTYFGNTAVWAGGQFGKVFTIEASAELHGQAVAKYGASKTIQFLQGTSPEVLRRVVPTLPEKVIYWLDAHWSGGPTFGESNECPLLEEIRAIDSRAHQAFFLIDDARLFLKPPPLPHRAEQWPDLGALVAALLEKDRSRFVAVAEDVIIAAPGEARNFFVDYCRRVAE